ncbi:YokU family protein [Sutcliffiella rhizosphaerae]|uniref:YokU family protein n=1 Tax=Sutcliffiella rhizosphaerae TaxID=2880967 RepID=UPI001E3DBAD0|nr:YokU family protein [Sutcliffiella rhizosphaerae]
MTCEWCQSNDAIQSNSTVYWELPDGTKAITITGTPSVACSLCGMEYQKESITKEIENQLFLIDTTKIETVLSFEELMGKPRLLKRNYFDFSS